MPQKRKPKQKAKVNHSGNKAAFDAVMNFLRRLGRPLIRPSHALNPEKAAGGGSVNPIKPTPVEFRADVFLAIRAACPADIDLRKFCLAYLLFDSEDAIEREKHAHTVLGDRRHSVEQRVGAEFIKRGIFPVQGKGYFYAPRG